MVVVEKSTFIGIAVCVTGFLLIIFLTDWSYSPPIINPVGFVLIFGVGLFFSWRRWWRRDEAGLDESLFLRAIRGKKKPVVIVIAVLFVLGFVILRIILDWFSKS